MYYTSVILYIHVIYHFKHFSALCDLYYVAAPQTPLKQTKFLDQRLLIQGLPLCPTSHLDSLALLRTFFTTFVRKSHLSASRLMLGFPARGSKKAEFRHYNRSAGIHVHRLTISDQYSTVRHALFLFLSTSHCALISSIFLQSHYVHIPIQESYMHYLHCCTRI